jgi:hypothetical protein
MHSESFLLTIALTINVGLIALFLVRWSAEYLRAVSSQSAK